MRSVVSPVLSASTDRLPVKPALFPLSRKVPPPAALVWKERLFAPLPARFPETVIVAAVALLWEMLPPPVPVWPV